MKIWNGPARAKLEHGGGELAPQSLALFGNSGACRSDWVRCPAHRSARAKKKAVLFIRASTQRCVGNRVGRFGWRTLGISCDGLPQAGKPCCTGRRIFVHGRHHRRGRRWQGQSRIIQRGLRKQQCEQHTGYLAAGVENRYSPSRAVCPAQGIGLPVCWRNPRLAPRFGAVSYGRACRENLRVRRPNSGKTNRGTSGHPHWSAEAGRSVGDRP